MDISVGEESQSKQALATMPLPEFNNDGDLPPGIHEASLDEIGLRFGTGTTRRKVIHETLLRLHNLAVQTGKLESCLIFGSYVTDKSEPNDVDIMLIMKDDFRPLQCGAETRKIFDHEEADKEFGVSVFWIRPSMLLFDTLDEFKAKWQEKRDGSRRGIVEVRQ